MRIAKKSWNLSLDSLSDTMTNGVGILILILVAVTPASLLDAGRQEAADTENPPVTSEVSPVPLSAEELKAKIAEMRETLDRLRQQMKKAEEQRQARQSQWDKLRKSNQPKELRVPTLELAPEGLERMFFVCRRRCVYPLDMKEMREKLMQAIRQATGQATGQITVGRAERVAICDYVNKHDIGDKYFQFKLEDIGFDVLVKVLLRPACSGESAARIRSPRSGYAKAIDAADPSERFVQFVVWNDSFDVYAVAREIVDRRSGSEPLLANWLPMKADEELRYLLLNGSSRRPTVQ